MSHVIREISAAEGRIERGGEWRVEGDFVAVDLGDGAIEREIARTGLPTEPDAATRMQHPKLARVTTVERGYAASRTSMDLPVSQLVLSTAEAARGPVVKLPTMGGSVPLEMMERVTGAPTITVPIANHDNNQHSANENIRLQNLWDGIEAMAALLEME